ncbi:unnamed protein product [Rotaria sp. Silwood2]|nr:unnamed protein product [Rotaria sp. Silwood2]CAF4322173.1 unnamed protein product [Rotaria sp. Silwood2]
MQLNHQANIVPDLVHTNMEDALLLNSNLKQRYRKNAEITNDPIYNFDENISSLNNIEEIYQEDSCVKEGNINYMLDNDMPEGAQEIEQAVLEQNKKLTSDTEKHGTDADPIIGYAEEPLLPLTDACAPLNDILYNLSYYVNMALEETPAQPPDELTIDESAAIRLYTIEWEAPHRSLYSMLNRTLKSCSREELRPYFRYMKLFLTALVKLPCSPPMTVWRGITKDQSADFPPGTPVTWWAFSSTTTQLTVLENNMYLGTTGARTLFSVEVINGRTVRAHSHFVTEDEILLLPGTHMIVQSQFSPAADLHIIHLKQVIPEKTLLEPPFEGTIEYVELFLQCELFFLFFRCMFIS